MKNLTRAAALLMFYFQSTPERLLVSNQTSASLSERTLAGKPRIKPRRAQITKEQRHEQEIYFGADADHRDGICADRQRWLDTRPATHPHAPHHHPGPPP